MKIRRYKKVNRHLSFFVNNYYFRQPYQLLVDGTFCYAALNNQINIADNIAKYLQGELKVVTTACTILEMESLDRKLGGALQILKKCVVHKCGHEKQPITGSECLRTMVADGNKSHYFIATQDRDLQKQLRLMCAVPIVYLHSRAPVLDPPSKYAMECAAEQASKGLDLQKTALDNLKEQHGILPELAAFRKRKRKGPNPLSCKKKNVAAIIERKKNATRGNQDIKKRGFKIRLAEHVKKELSKS